jgi:hypothetical protein
MLSAMARELVEKNGIGDNADAIWRALDLEHQKLFPTDRPGDANHSDSNGGEVPYKPAHLIEAAINAEPVLIFGQSSDSLKTGRVTKREKGYNLGFRLWTHEVDEHLHRNSPPLRNPTPALNAMMHCDVFGMA